MNDGNIGSTNHTIIPYNSSNQAAAACFAKRSFVRVRPNSEKAKPEVWGAMPGIEMDRTGPEIFREFMEIKKHPANNPIEQYWKAPSQNLKVPGLEPSKRGKESQECTVKIN